ncbi:GT1 domain-containing protein [Latimeria chalumnae]|uniref:Myb-like domain-containing protein n=1 Tax=Latimeria chalumnae TaxID=7897 RepID=M3XJG6_LATCH|nr:PREDICTED: uncharacterized protein LOC102345628 [Latimeria chalumnae]|eukprot:XP_006011077.1 PREDICTED: uncharacterized protein LOC102345628 [Latimeria chalumnae]
MTEKKRNPNWSEEEKTILLREYEKRKHILTARSNPLITLAIKQNQWEEITRAINTHSFMSLGRTVQEVKKKYENLSTRARKEYNEFKKISGATGGDAGPEPLSKVTKLVLELFGEDSPALAEIPSRLGSTRPSEIKNEAVENVLESPKRQDAIKRLQSKRAGSAVTDVVPEEKKKQSEEIFFLQKEVLQLKKTKLKLEIEKLTTERNNLKLKNIILNHKVHDLIQSGKICHVDNEIISSFTQRASR